MANPWTRGAGDIHRCGFTTPLGGAVGGAPLAACAARGRLSHQADRSRAPPPDGRLLSGTMTAGAGSPGGSSAGI